MKKDNPLVTVYIPTYNRLFLLKRAVDSVLSQTYENVELIISDDNSSDGTVDYLKVLAEKNENVTVIFNGENKGACFCRNKAIHMARGDYITGLDDDDYFLPTRIADFVSYWPSRRKDTVALFSNNLVMRSKFIKTKKNRKRIVSSSDLITLNHIGNQIFTRSVNLKNIGGYDQDFPAWQDIEMWYRLLKGHECYAECVPIYNYVVDISHPHERLSDNKQNKVQTAYCKFVEKHDIPALERKVLAYQLLAYKKNILFRLANFIMRPVASTYLISQRRD